MLRVYKVWKVLHDTWTLRAAPTTVLLTQTFKKTTKFKWGHVHNILTTNPKYSQTMNLINWKFSRTLMDADISTLTSEYHWVATSFIFTWPQFIQITAGNAVYSSFVQRKVRPQGQRICYKIMSILIALVQCPTVYINSQTEIDTPGGMPCCYMIY